MVDKHIVFIYSSKAKQVGVPADIAGVPLCRVGDRDEVVVAYAGVLWEGQITKLPNAEAAKNAIKGKPVYIAISEAMEIDQVSHWIEEQGYKQVMPKDDADEIKP